jgi:hypothetical protein
MVRDGVANIVIRLQESGFDPRKVGPDSWESRCPAHRSADCALSITRNEHNHVLLECRSVESCQHIRIIRALGFTNEHLYAETADWLINRLGRVPIQPALFVSADPMDSNRAGASAVEGPNGSDGSSATDEGGPNGKEVSSPDSAVRPPQPASGRPLPEGRGDSALAAASPAHPNPLLVVERVMGGTDCVAERDDAVSSLPFPISSPAGPASPIEQVFGTTLELHLASITLIEETGDKRERPSSVQVLTQLASGARLFRSADGHFCAQVRVGDRLEIYGLRSDGFRDWLIDGYMNGQTEPPSSWAIRRVVGMLEARARFTTGMPEVFVRVGQDGDGADAVNYLDLGDSSGRAVAIRDQGWCVVDRPEVHFRRPGGLRRLPLPARDGSVDLLRSYVNLTEPDFRLMIAWLTAALRPVGPYPVLVLNGEQSSGKSTLAKILRLLIDPHACPVLALPSSTENLMATALNGWLLAYENISTIPDWLSDCVCQLAFGGGFASRALFTNDERSDIYAQRPVILVGIDDFVLRGDLRDRSVFLHLPAIPEARRQTERAFWSAFRADQPRIFGGVLDAIVGGLRELPSVELKELPRMADFAEWGEATGRGLGWGADTFITTYKDNRKEATHLLLEDSPVATVLLTLARREINWSGKAQDLYKAVVEIRGKSLRSRLPKSISKFGSELLLITPQLRLHGVSINFKRRGMDRIVTMHSKGIGTGPPSTSKPKA